MPAAASQLGLQWQLQQQGGSDRAELSSALSLSSQLPSPIGKLLKLMNQIMINAYMCVCGLELELGQHIRPSGPAPVRPCCNSSRALGGRAWN